MGQQLFLLRALAASHQRSIGAGDIKIVKRLGRLVNARVDDLDREMEAILLALEDKAFLKAGLQKIPEKNKTYHTSPRKRTI